MCGDDGSELVANAEVDFGQDSVVVDGGQGVVVVEVEEVDSGSMPTEDIEQTLERGVVKEEVKQLIKQETSTKLAAVLYIL